MTINHFNDVNVYFHMKSHYRKIRNVKSSVDDHISQVYLRPLSSCHSEKCLNLLSDEKHSKNCMHIPNHSISVKKHNCFAFDAKSDSSVLCQTSRPSTRRNFQDALQQNKFRSSSVGPSRRISSPPSRVNKSKIYSNRIVHDSKKAEVQAVYQLVASSDSQTTIEETFGLKKSKCTESNWSSNQFNIVQTSSSRKKNSVNQEYLHFLLRITEDIIMNDYYTSKDIGKVLRSHIEANKDRLDLRMMKAHIAHLCRELDIKYDCPEDSFEPPGIVYFSKNSKLDTYNFGDCECAKLQNIENELCGTDKNYTSMKDAANLDYSHCPRTKVSLGRLTECTEPIESSTTSFDASKMSSQVTLSGQENDVLISMSKINSTSYTEKDERFSKASIVSKIASEDPVDDQNAFEVTKNYVVSQSSNDLHNSYDVPEGTSEPESNMQHIHGRRNIESGEENDDFIQDLGIISIDTTSDNEIERETLQHSCSASKILIDKSTLELECHTDKLYSNNKNVAHKFNNSENQELITSDRGECDNKSNSSFDGNLIKIILERNIKEDDFVLINGPVYVLKALMNTNPKLILTENNEINFKNGNTNSHNVSEGVQNSKYEEELKNFAYKSQQDNRYQCSLILESSADVSKSKSDSVLPTVDNTLNEDYVISNIHCHGRLLQSDYDLTPERENKFNCARHSDASNSVSSSRIPQDTTENLLMGDSYLISLENPSKFLNNYTAESGELPEHDYTNDYLSPIASTTTVTIMRKSLLLLQDNYLINDQSDEDTAGVNTLASRCNEDKNLQEMQLFQEKDT